MRTQGLFYFFIFLFSHQIFEVCFVSEKILFGKFAIFSKFLLLENSDVFLKPISFSLFLSYIMINSLKTREGLRKRNAEGIHRK